MTNHPKGAGPKTTIWREEGSKTIQLETIPGLPFGIPSMGQKLFTTKYGEAQCSGIDKSGTGENEQVIEVKLTVK